MSITKTTAFLSKEEELLQELHRYKAAYAEASSRADIASTIIQKQRGYYQRGNSSLKVLKPR